MLTLTFTPTSARYLAQAALAAVAPHDMTPVLAGAHLRLDGGSHVVVTATDRFRVHRARIELAEPTKATSGDDVILPATLLRWLLLNARYFNRRRDAEPAVVKLGISRELGKVTASVEQPDGEASVSWAGALTNGTFPPVERIIQKARDAEPVTTTGLFNLSFLGATAALGKLPSIKYTAHDDPGKPGPALLTFKTNGEIVAEAIIQPNMDLS